MNFVWKKGGMRHHLDSDSKNGLRQEIRII